MLSLSIHPSFGVASPAITNKPAPQPIELTPDNFDATVLRADKPVLVDFWADWCQPCKTMNPTIAQLAKDMGNKATIAKVDVGNTQNDSLAKRYAITSIPTVILFNNGEEVKRYQGVQQLETLSNSLNRLTTDSNVTSLQ